MNVDWCSVTEYFLKYAYCQRFKHRTIHFGRGKDTNGSIINKHSFNNNYCETGDAGYHVKVYVM